MSHFVIIFLIFVFSISFIITLIWKIAFWEVKVDIDSQYYDENGDHIYYDRSLIEKKIFRKKYPHITNIRTLNSFFKQRVKG